jgi:hypothetical protein
VGDIENRWKHLEKSFGANFKAARITSDHIRITSSRDKTRKLLLRRSTANWLC